MGKIKTVIMGDEKAEEKARAKAMAKREGKKQLKKIEASTESVKISSESVKSDSQKSADILKMMATDSAEASTAKADSIKVSTTKKVKPAKTVKTTPSPLPLTPKSKHGKKYLAILNLFDKEKTYPSAEAIALVKKTSYSSFDGTIEVIFNVTEKNLRGSVALPHGTGKKVKVVVATDELLEEITTGKINFDILVAHPSMMPKLAKVAKILGPKGLMPNPKTGTIGENPEELVKKLTAGQVNWKTQPDFPIIHTVLGKVSFEDKKLEENFLALIKSIGKDKIKSVFIKATMGPSVKVIV